MLKNRRKVKLAQQVVEAFRLKPIIEDDGHLKIIKEMEGGRRETRYRVAKWAAEIAANAQGAA